MIASLLVMGTTAVAQSDPVPGKNGNKYVPYEERTGNESIVYFTRNLSAEGLIEAYEQVSADIKGHTGVKLHTGERNGPNIIPREWVKALFRKDLSDANIVETNTYYEGDRYTTEQHDAASAQRFRPPWGHGTLLLPVRFALLDRMAVSASESFRPRAARYLLRRQRQRSRYLPMWRWPHGQIWAVRERLVLWILLWLSWPPRNSRAKWISPMWQKLFVHPHTAAAQPSIAAFPE